MRKLIVTFALSLLVILSFNSYVFSKELPQTLTSKESSVTIFNNQKVTPLDYPAYIVTGGPGSGKTTLLNELQKKGYTFIEEVARDVIKQEVEIEGEGVPWKNLEIFNKLLLSKSISDYKNLLKNIDLSKKENRKPIFFDRGIPDVMAYMRMGSTEPLPKEYINAAVKYPYNKTVFLLPSWEKIYKNDSERKETFAEAVKISESLKKTYVDLGYNVVEIPVGEIETRVQFIIDYLSNH